MTRFHSVAIRHGGGKDEHGYGEIYEPYLSKLNERTKETGLRVLELGVSRGHSLRIWQEYFTKPMTIAGIDKDLSPFIGDRSSFELYQFDLRAQGTLAAWAETHGEWDLIVDDAGHHVRDTQQTFDVLWSKLRSKGVMILEDLHTNWLPNANAEHQPTTYAMVHALRDKTVFESKYISAARFENLRMSVASAEVWARRTGSGEVVGTTKTRVEDSYTVRDSVTSVIVKL